MEKTINAVSVVIQLKISHTMYYNLLRDGLLRRNPNCKQITLDSFNSVNEIMMRHRKERGVRLVPLKVIKESSIRTIV